MYHPPSKRNQLIKRTAVYGAMSIAVISLVTVLVLIMQGYQFDKKDGRIEQGGLIQFNTTPSGATVTIDGTNHGTLTPSKKTTTTGQHFVTMQRDGYKTWQKSVDLAAGSVLWLNYARLIPNELTPNNVADFPVVSSTSPSPDDKWMAIKEDPATPIIRLADLSREDAALTTLTLPSSSFTAPGKGKKQQFTLEAWDPSSRYMLLKHTYNSDKMEWLVVDINDVEKTKNVTELLDVDATKLVFSNADSHILYAQIDDDLRKIDLNAATLSRPLVQNVAEFSLYDRAVITYVTRVDPQTKQRSVGYYNDGASKARAIRTYSDNGKLPLHMSIDKYFGDSYVAIAHGDVVDIFEADTLPRSDASSVSSLDAVATVTIPGGTDYLSIRTNGRFIVAQHDTSYTVYDLELKKSTTTKLEGKADAAKRLRWLDNYTVWSDRDGVLRLSEFDGANQHTIMPVASGQSVTLSPSDKYLYGITKSKDDTYHLTRVQLILP